ncbi:unnamed protein product [Zymoseptoria tritici ST99CH_1A5]|uniref:Uncharacterized protein n=5 Tax=Zymoseptoria TaxID=1047167 RepID=A0A0F4GFT6_9PEZI|nr:uncharacterized protein MYCGRDRAFT_103030 [Zymoseptoria tritici IPO323]KJX95025.1 hypothetical protein TI39_contig4141g00006 [Zymoseptoria brevis]SMQ47165.1 unnamed protein product [Zymoseptoria tritici ST99CH_3D7]SMR45690.1 unnamed protein product [Zymoseptoria tritici ST99CH_1E4]SMY20843.1 unnamed protein product [Zymoseptoria tritici ST99CH_1A5]EGP90759.1 hypothetical protein MYCGRDRAFT_103030 [Zymoseptoria tritici IPO323]
MPRDGSGHSHNAVEGEELVHGAPTGNDGKGSEVDRSDKAAAPPAHEAGEAITNPASGGGSVGLTGVGSGKGGETTSK